MRGRRHQNFIICDDYDKRDFLDRCIPHPLPRPSVAAAALAVAMVAAARSARRNEKLRKRSNSLVYPIQ
jgi:hypothetical protein